VKGSDKAVVFGVIMAVILGIFYLKVLGPKRDEASSLKKDIADLHGQIDEQKQVADFAEDARQHFPQYYGRLVVMGKAVPGNSDTSSLLVQLNSIANRTGVSFDGISLSSGTGSGDTAAPAPAATDTSSTSTSTTSTTSSSATTTPTATPPPATESTAANLPLGAVVGSAGLPTMPYDMNFQGTYFDVANFLKGVDGLVHVHGTSEIDADGRLLTVSGFVLEPAPNSKPDDPELNVTLAVTSYVTPAEQGLTAGATPGGPAPSLTQPQTQPVSAAVTP
jgi:Tfp pilus assembly protein PilO